MSRKLVIGCGYLGKRVAALWRDAGDEVFVVTRSNERAQQFERDGFRPIVANVTRRETLTSLLDVATMLWAVGYDRRQDSSIENVYVDGLRNALNAISAVDRMIYISSTGVYGDAGGEWIDEETPCRPTRPGGVACLKAEQLLSEHRLGAQSIILRLAGIYGPGRIPRAEALRAGEPIAAPSDGYLNLIHVDDAAQIVLAAERAAPLPRCYVVSDGHPVQRGQYYRELAKLLAAPEPQFVPPDAATHAAQRAASDKRVANARMIRELSVTLKYRNFRDGLKQIVASDSSQRL